MPTEDFKTARTVVFGVSKLRWSNAKTELALPVSNSFAAVTAGFAKLFDVIRPQNLLGKQIMGVDKHLSD